MWRGNAFAVMADGMGTRAELASAGALLMLALAALVMSFGLATPAQVETVLAAPLPVLPLPRVEGRAGRPLVVIDAGHGGHDPGASGSDLREKDVTLTVALAIRDAIMRQGRMRVALTRSDDRYLLLGERPEIARGLGADLFVSVHADSGGGAGATIYTLSETASDPAAARTADRENRFGAAARDDEVAAILDDLTRESRLAASLAFAERLHAAGGALPFKTDYRQSANFVVLRGATMPSALLELGYLSNPQDSVRLKSPDARAAIGEAVARAADLFLTTRK